MGFDDRCDQAGEPLIDFGAARRVLHFHALAFSPNQSGVPERLEMLGERRLRNLFLAHLQESRARLRATRTRDLGENRYPHRIGERMHDPFDGDVFNRGVEKRLHDFQAKRVLTLCPQFVSSEL